jgi:hypothetical protein
LLGQPFAIAMMPKRATRISLAARAFKAPLLS